MGRKKLWQPEAKYAPRNYSTPRGDEQPRGRDYLVLEDAKFQAVLTRIDDKFQRGQIDTDEALYLKDYARRMRVHWGPWFDSTSVNYIVYGGLEEIRALQRRDAFVSNIAILKELHEPRAS